MLICILIHILMHILIRILMHMHVGMSLHHCQFQGALLKPSTFVNMICDIVWSFQQSSNITHFSLLMDMVVMPCLCNYFCHIKKHSTQCRWKCCTFASDPEDEDNKRRTRVIGAAFNNIGEKDQQSISMK